MADYTVTDQTNFLEITLDGKVLRDSPKKLISCTPMGEYVEIREKKKGGKPAVRFKIKYSECSDPAEANASDLSDSINAIINS